MNETTNTALKLFGGVGRMKAMLGAQHLCYNDKDNSFQFHFKGSRKASIFKMTYDCGMDLFNLEFGKVISKKDPEYGIRSQYYKVVNEETGVYANQVIEIFEKITGLCTHL